jgi:hypothetical protein
MGENQGWDQDKKDDKRQIQIFQSSTFFLLALNAIQNSASKEPGNNNEILFILYTETRKQHRALNQ